MTIKINTSRKEGYKTNEMQIFISFRKKRNRKGAIFIFTHTLHPTSTKKQHRLKDEKELIIPPRGQVFESTYFHLTFTCYSCIYMHRNLRFIILWQQNQEDNLY